MHDLRTRVPVGKLSEHAGSDNAVMIAGWVRLRRTSGAKLAFLEIRDGSGRVQVVVNRKDVGDEAMDAVARVPIESSIVIHGTVHEDKRQVGGVEIHATGVHVLHESVDDYPLGKKDHGEGFLQDQRHLWLRSTKTAAVLRVRAEVIAACRDHLGDQGFTCVDAPIFNSAAAEGTATLFPVEYFGSTVYLSQTGQLHMEAAAQALGKVYCFGPTFRAEKSKTRRHLTEFWMLEPEIAFADLDEDMDLMESLIAYVVERVITNCSGELATLERDVESLKRCVPPFPRISYDEALERLKGHEAEIPWGEDFGAPQETAVSKQFDRPILVHRFPMKIKAFYMKADPERPEVVLGCDMIAPDGYGEIIGGGERSSDLAYLEHKIAEEGLPKEAYEWYLDLRRYGASPSAGFGMGLERVVAWLCDIGHVRKAIPFARTMARTHP